MAWQTNLAMAWIDYKKAYDMVSHSWIMECLDMIVAADAVKCILGESMKTWITNLTANDECLGKGASQKSGTFEAQNNVPVGICPRSSGPRERSTGPRDHAVQAFL